MAKVLFVQDALYECFGPQFMSAVAKEAGHETELFTLSADGEKNYTRKLRQYRPDIVALSITSFGFKWAIEAGRVAKKEIGALTVFGGAHPTFAPDFAKHHPDAVDLACKGEGEGAFVDLCDAIDNKTDPTDIPNMISVRPDG